MSSWEERELPVLRALAEHFRTKPHAEVGLQSLARRTGFRQDEVVASLRRLAESKGPYVSGSGLVDADGPPRVTGLTERARSELAHLSSLDADPAHPSGHILPPGAAAPPAPAQPSESASSEGGFSPSA